VGVWVCGCVGVWVCGCVGVWVCGCVVVWLCCRVDRFVMALCITADINRTGYADMGVTGSIVDSGGGCRNVFELGLPAASQC